jgi:hypothetical protein
MRILSIGKNYPAEFLLLGCPKNDKKINVHFLSPLKFKKYLGRLGKLLYGISLFQTLSSKLSFMKSFQLMILLSLALSANTFSQAPQFIEVQTNAITEVTGNLSEGAIMDDLSWAWSSQNACFPETRVDRFTGSHVLYSCDLPKYSEYVITVIPDDKTANFSLYAYQVGLVGADNTVPKLPSCIRCEAAFKWAFKRRGQTQDHTRTVKDILAINNPYQVVIGVVGAEGLASGGYTLRITAKSK